MGQNIQECTKWNFWKTTFKKFEVIFNIIKSNIRNFETNFSGKYDYLGCENPSINKQGKVFTIEPNENCGRQPLKIWRDMACSSRYLDGYLTVGYLLFVYLSQ